MTALSDIPFSLLDLASVPKGHSIPETFERLARHAQQADKLGFQRFWLAEHHNLKGVASSATTVLMGHLASKTERLRIGSGGIMLPNHPPLIVAEQLGTLDCLYPGRIDLGLGRAPGTDPLTIEALRYDHHRAHQFPDEVAELQTLLGPNSHAKVQAYPGSDSQVNIWLLGSSLFSAQLAAQRGLPYAFAGHFAPGLAYEALTLYQQQFQASDVLKEPYAMLCVPLVLTDTDEDAALQLTSTQQRVLSLFKRQPLYLPPPVEDMGDIWSPIEAMQVSSFLSLAISGSPATARSKLEALLQRYPVQELMFTNDIYDEDKRLHALELLWSLRQED